jgi:hypothetical protein
MATKELTELMIKTRAPSLIKDLGLADWSIHFHVFEDAEAIQRDPDEAIRGLYAKSFYDAKSKSADIVMFHSKLKGKSDIVSTLIHELLHLLISKLKIGRNKAITQSSEENVILILEKFIAKRLKS